MTNISFKTNGVTNGVLQQSRLHVFNARGQFRNKTLSLQWRYGPNAESN